jgi:hypothetical protein
LPAKQKLPASHHPTHNNFILFSGFKGQNFLINMQRPVAHEIALHTPWPRNTFRRLCMRLSVSAQLYLRQLFRSRCEGIWKLHYQRAGGGRTRKEDAGAKFDLTWKKVALRRESASSLPYFSATAAALNRKTGTLKSTSIA